ncbi:Ribosome production factor 2 like protein [Tritrichomonas foetus]|uniref:Ribosome production factor 2 homolog n=1 Tax=Tritrichomonas foetus TaxID=1144522 RepID=A0A1J4K2C0_9EUKA|nr:Ribosome production factor 2 like protein [Tritrichomonas foetus]|eukprot:OHT04936.1 Ribosome production factor 2 like protein [Tritrichomonas foetus]
MKAATTHKGKKILEDRAPKIQENRKQSLFIKGRKVSQELNYFWDELAKFRYGEIQKYSKNNDFLPFESVAEVEKACKKFNCSLFTFYSHNKKRPMNVVFGRCFDFVVMEMYEFGVQNFVRATEGGLPHPEIEPGAVPALIFQGDQWETEFSHVRSVFMDFFVGEFKGNISPEQIQHALVFTIVEGEITYIACRHYQVQQGATESKLMQVSPSFDLVPRRKMLPDEAVMQKALEKPAQDKKKKNITKNELGQVMGRVFTPKQKVNEIVPKGFRGLPKAKFERPAEPADDAL